MTPKLLLRIAAVIMLLHAAGHTMGVYTWKDPVNPQHDAVIKSMADDSFLFMGRMGGMGKFYEGFGYAGTIAMLLSVAILWLIASEAENNPGVANKILWPVAIYLLLLGAIELIWFFPFAASFSLLSTALTVVAIFRLKGK